MITYTTGNLLHSTAEALVNTVNCEGYMGKGIAYQFKLRFPKNNEDYIKACRNGGLKIGKLHHYKEDGKTIINFPTKDKWREKSKIEYIQAGMDELVKLVQTMEIESIAIPPLGSGNGGLIWAEVKQLIEKNLSVLSDEIKVYIYEPSKNYATQPTVEPKLSLSALVLMEIKNQLEKFDSLRLQKTAYFMNLFSRQNYFRFQRHKFGPYDNSIAIISNSIKEFQQYHNASSTAEVYKILYNKIVSGNVECRLKEFMPSIEKATRFVNSIKTNHELECLSTILFLVEEKKSLAEQDIIASYKAWSEDKAKRYSELEIANGIQRLESAGIIEQNLMGYSIKN